ncbi:hypothetical protein M9H77_08754 [Catharanthus roseus]|uniref:Uncharacterized protein n=1 Tax=Catharanthus roseus TaxID=4058 RepID=A0ACC0BYZ6_CATRO|nr:hypothetical protein M9H77_08754 [Catharanthus roseus]
MLPICSQFVQQVRITQGSKLDVKMVKCWKRAHLPLTAALLLLSLLGLWTETVEKYNWSNQSWKRIEAKSKQEDHQSKCAKDMHNFHHGGGNGVNAYGAGNHGHGNFISKRHNGVSNFSSNAKSYGRTSYDHYGDVEEEAFKEEPCCIMSGKSIEIKEKERMEEKERLMERSCKFDSISIISKGSEHFEYSKEKESELEKSEIVKENEWFIEKQESEKEEQRDKEIVIFEKSEEVNFYANKTNSFFASEFLCVQNFEDSSKDEGGKLAYKFTKTINFFSSNSYLSFEIYFNIYGDICAISFCDDLFLVIPYVSKRLSSHISFEDSLMHRSAKFDPLVMVLVDYDFKLLMSFDMLSLSIDHALSLEGKIKMEFVKLIPFKNHEGNEVNHKKFGMTRLVFDPGGPGKKLKIHDAIEENGMVIYMENVLKKKVEGFTDQGKASKLLSIYKNKNHSRDKLTATGTPTPTLSIDFGRNRFGSQHPTAFGRFPPYRRQQDRKSQAYMKLKLGPLTRALGRKLKIHDANLANGLVAYMAETLKNKLEVFEAQGKDSRMNLNETLRSIPQSIERLARQFQSIARAIEELRRGKSSAIMKQKDNPNVGQAYHDVYYGNQHGDKALDKIKWKILSFKGQSVPTVFLDWE